MAKKTGSKKKTLDKITEPPKDASWDFKCGYMLAIRRVKELRKSGKTLNKV